MCIIKISVCIITMTIYSNDCFFFDFIIYSLYLFFLHFNTTKKELKNLWMNENMKQDNKLNIYKNKLLKRIYLNLI